MFSDPLAKNIGQQTKQYGLEQGCKNTPSPIVLDVDINTIPKSDKKLT